MPEPTSLVNLGELAKPVTVLIEKISAAMGAAFQPFQIKRVAKAEADAAIIKAEGEITVTALHRRAMTRFFEEEANKQENMEQIAQKSLPSVSESARPDQMEDDWVSNFFEKCRIISDEEMQTLWARVLAGEANSPGSYSKRTVNLLASFDKHDADLFGKICGLVWWIGEPTPLIYEVPVGGYFGINFDEIMHLANIGLLRLDMAAGFRKLGSSKRISTICGRDLINLDFEHEASTYLDAGHALFTNAGKELFRVCQVEPRQDFVEYVLKRWVSTGLSPYSPYPRVKVQFPSAKIGSKR